MTLFDNKLVIDLDNVSVSEVGDWIIETGCDGHYDWKYNGAAPHTTLSFEYVEDMVAFKLRFGL